MNVEQPDAESRFRDPRTHLYALSMPDILVVCPRCGGAAVVRPQPEGTTGPLFRPRTLFCAGCAYSARWEPKLSSRWGGPFDPFFGRPLWLQASCCGGKTLWAYNCEHLDLIDGYVRAQLRERGPDRAYTSMLEKLPAWIKTAKHREEIARTITRLRATLPSEITGRRTPG